MKKLIIYTDGSHLDKQHGGRLGIGGVLVDPMKNKAISEFSEGINPKYMKITYGAQTCSNPTMELLAAYYALVQFKKELNSLINGSSCLIVTSCANLP